MDIPQHSEFTVIIHLSENEFSKNLDKTIQERISNCEEYGVSSSEGRIYYEIDFNSWDDAVASVESLAELRSNPNILMLLARSYTNDDITPIIYKDDIRPHRVNR